MGREEDIELVAKASEGDEEAFRRLVVKYRKSVFTLCARSIGDHDAAEDLAQEVFVRVFKNLARFDPAYAFSGWLFKIASNLCIDHLRRQRPGIVSMDSPVQGKEGDFSRQFVSEEDGPEREFEKARTRRILEEAVAKLPPDYRQIIHLRHGQGFTYEEIAQILDVPLGTVKARIHRARKMLRALLKGTDLDPG